MKRIPSLKSHGAVPVSIFLFLLCLCATTASSKQSELRLSFANLSEWREKSFKGHTSYTAVQDEGRTVLQAVALGTASALHKKIAISATELPVIRWSWKVKQALAAENPYRKDVDDFAARVCIFFPGTFFWQYTALVYVWSDKLPVGTVVPSAFNSNIALIVVESGNKNAGVWRYEQRNYLEDYQNFFHTQPPGTIDVAVMTDADNTKGEATAWYGDILFSKNKN